MPVTSNNRAGVGQVQPLGGRFSFSNGGTSGDEAHDHTDGAPLLGVHAVAAPSGVA